MLKYYLKTIQESKMLYYQLTKQGMKRVGLVPEWDGYTNDRYIEISPVDRKFSYHIDYGTSGVSIICHTLCHSVTEVLKRTWGTWVEPKRVFCNSVDWAIDYDTSRVLQYCTDTEVGEFGKKLISLMKHVMRRNR